MKKVNNQHKIKVGDFVKISSKLSSHEIMYSKVFAMSEKEDWLLCQTSDGLKPIESTDVIPVFDELGE